MTVIQICGTNGVGKSTLVRSLLPHLFRDEIMIDGEKREVWKDDRITVIGKYNERACGGIDAGGYTTETLSATLRAVMRSRPRYIVFEDANFGSTYAFKKRVRKTAEQAGGKYICVTLYASELAIVERIIERSGNEDRNFDSIIGKQRSVIRTSRKMQADGAAALFIDTTNKGKQEVADILFEVMHDGAH